MMKALIKKMRRGYYALNNLLNNKEDFEQMMRKDINKEEDTMFSTQKTAAQRTYDRITELPQGKQTNVLLGVIGKDQISYTIKYADESELQFDRKTMELKVG